MPVHFLEWRCLKRIFEGSFQASADHYWFPVWYEKSECQFSAPSKYPTRLLTKMLHLPNYFLCYRPLFSHRYLSSIRQTSPNSHKLFEYLTFPPLPCDLYELPLDPKNNDEAALSQPSLALLLEDVCMELFALTVTPDGWTSGFGSLLLLSCARPLRFDLLLLLCYSIMSMVKVVINY